MHSHWLIYFALFNCSENHFWYAFGNKETVEKSTERIKSEKYRGKWVEKELNAIWNGISDEKTDLENSCLVAYFQNKILLKWERVRKEFSVMVIRIWLKLDLDDYLNWILFYVVAKFPRSHIICISCQIKDSNENKNAHFFSADTIASK